MIASLLLMVALQTGSATVVWESEIAQDANGSSIVLTGRMDKRIDHISGTVEYMSCEGDACNMPEDFSFDETVSGTVVDTPASKPSKPLLALILEAILWGFAMLLTPCVFPMVPMTVSFFLKGSEDKVRGKLRASAYGLFIILLYTLPICLIIGVTWIAGGGNVTADIFNWLSTHWIPNILFFIIFMAFAASFFGAFEFNLPSRWSNGADKNSGRNGLAGVFFMALTLVLVSFSCTGPIVGTVLIKSTQGEFWTPMVTMLAFSIAFALPFTLLALFPSILRKIPKSGSWLNSIKIILGFIEVALGFKFLSTADQTYHWGILDREVYLAIWIACFSLLGLYLLGKLKFKNDGELEYLSVKRLALAIADFAFVIYLIPGMWGAPLKALSGYLPPIEIQEYKAADISEYTSLEEGLRAAKSAGKPVFLDITGHGCVNCREMEARVWSVPEVRNVLRRDFIMIKLFVDDKTPLPESDWVTTPSGKVLKDVGRVNSYTATEVFGVNSQPSYFLLDSDGGIIAGPYSYNLNAEAFLSFLQKAQ